MAVKFLINLLNAAARWVEHLPLAFIDNAWIYPAEVLASYPALLAYMRHTMVRSAKSLYLIGVCLLVTGSLHWAWRTVDRPVQSIIFCNVRGYPVVHCIESQGKPWLAYADSIPDKRRLSRAVTGYWNRLHLNTPIPITKDYCSSGLWMQDHLLLFGNRRICMVSDNRWRNKTVAELLNVDYLYLCKGYTRRLESLAQLSHCRGIILDSSLFAYYKGAFSEECRWSGLYFTSLSDEGSVRFLL